MIEVLTSLWRAHPPLLFFPFYLRVILLRSICSCFLSIAGAIAVVIVVAIAVTIAGCHVTFVVVARHNELHFLEGVKGELFVVMVFR